MRIISGQFKGRQLASFKADHIRPTTDRVKETLFNKLRLNIEESFVLDLFAGTGNLGLEALSRFAKHVTFVESHQGSLKIIYQNIDLLKIQKSQCTIFKSDVFKFLNKESNSKLIQEMDIIFIDPPFTDKLAHLVMTDLSKVKMKSSVVIAIESVKQEIIMDQYGELVCYDKQDYGDKSLSLFCKADNIDLNPTV